MAKPKRNKSTQFLAPISLTSVAVCLPMLLAALPAYSQSGSGNAQPNSRCGTIADPALRLACYDKANSAGGISDTTQRGHWPEFTGTPALPARAAPHADTVAPSSSGPARNRTLAAGVTSFSFSTGRRFTVILDNGQIWRQLDSDNDVAQFRDHGPNRVVISHGFLRSYDLRLNDMSAIFKVERVK